MTSKPPAGRSSAVEDYLEQILDLINTKGYARVADIAQRLKISQASVTNIVQKHHLLTDFLRMLGIEDDVIYHDVEGMEHHISPQTLRAIEGLVNELQQHPKLLGRLRNYTHGS